MRTLFLTGILAVACSITIAQSAIIRGTISFEKKPLEFVTVRLEGTSFGTSSNEQGKFVITNIPTGTYELIASIIGYENSKKKFELREGQLMLLNIELNKNAVQLEEIVVSGVTKETLIRENPIAITAISSKQLETSSGSNIIDNLAKVVPGLNVVKTGPNISKPFIHGLGYSRVLTIYDGLRQEGQQWGDEHGVEVDHYNIEKAEVIKGPASLMYGSDALAGAVSLFPFLPKTEDGKLHGKYTSEYQTNNNLIGNGLRLEFSNRHFVSSLRGSYRFAKNYRNPIDGRVYLSNFDEKNFSTLVGYKTQRGYTHLNLTLYDNRQGIPDGSRDSLTRKFTNQIFEGDDDDIKNRPIVSEQALNSYKIPALSQHIQHYRAYLHSFCQLGSGDMDVIVGVQQNIRREYIHPTMPEKVGMFVRLNTLNYSLRYNIPKFNNIALSAGINGMLQSNKNKDATHFPIPNYSLYDGGAFVYAKWKKESWTVSGGIRYDLRHIQWNEFYVETNPLTGFDQQSNTANPNAELQFDAYQKTFQGVSASLGTTFRVSKNISLKANIGRAYRSPNIPEMSSNGLDPGAHIIYLGNRNFNPEFSLQEDFGISGKFREISFEASAFNNNIGDFIYLTMMIDAQGNLLMDAQGNKTYQYQQSKGQLYGGELWFALHPEKLNNFRINNSLSLIYGFNRNSIFKNKGVEGEYLPLIPPLKLTSGISQDFRFKTRRSFTITPKVDVEFNAGQNRYLGLNGTETGTPSYTLFNAGFYTEFAYSQAHSFQFVFQVNNLFDKAFQSNLNRLKYFEYYERTPDNRYGIYNMGRNIVLKMMFPF